MSSPWTQTVAVGANLRRLAVKLARAALLRAKPRRRKK
jgi:hypothetical protein